MRTFTLLVILLLVGEHAYAAPETSAPDKTLPPVIGQIVSRGAQLNGFPVPAGSTLVNRTLVKTSDYPAIVHLRTGSILELSGGCEAFMERTPDGRIRVLLVRGSLSHRSQDQVSTVPAPVILFFDGPPARPEWKQSTAKSSSPPNLTSEELSEDIKHAQENKTVTLTLRTRPSVALNSAAALLSQEEEASPASPVLPRPDIR